MRSFRFRVVTAFVPLVLLASLATAQEEKWPTTEPQVPAEIRLALQDRNYAAAIEAIDKVADDAQDRDYLSYLKGRSYHYLEQYDEAIRHFDLFAKQYEESKWARAARFAKAASLARKGDYRAAELIYKAEAEYFLSDSRREEIGAIYLDFADSYFKPADESKQPDYNTARTFYEKALETLKSGEKAVEVRLRIGQCFQNAGNNQEARKQYQTILDNHPGHELAVEAQFLLGEAFLNDGNHEAARRAWRDLLDIYADKKSDRLPEAAFRIAATYGIPNPGDEEDLNLGVAALRKYLDTYPEHKQAGVAHLQIAQSYVNHGRHDDAAAALTAFLADDRFADSEQTPAARFMLGQVYGQQEKFTKAEETLKEFLVKHSTDSLWSAAQQELVNLKYTEAMAAFEEKNYKQARNLFTMFTAQHPLDSRHPAALYRLGQIDYLAEDYEAAIAQWRKLGSKFPGSTSANLAQFMIARTLQEKLENYEEAIKEYKKVEQDPYRTAARRSIARLTAKSMKIVTPRVYRSDESPRIRLTSRNIEEVTVRAYQIDLETYFRKMHLANGVEALDVSLIDPNLQFEFKLPEYEAHRQTSHEIEVDLPADKNNGSTVMAITVSSTTMEATTLVLQSDLDIIVKSSRDEVFVFAQNMLTGKPFAGASVLVSNGSEVFATGTTNDDGVFRGSHEELKSADDVRVLAIGDGHPASNVVGLSGVGVAQGLEARGFIDTDRPAYRPGQVVHMRGIIRRVTGDTYAVDEGKQYLVDVFDPRGRLLFDQEVKLSRFGSFHAHVMLPGAAPQGQYRISVYDRQEREQYNGTFQVSEFQLEPVQIEVDTPRNVYYRGEEIEGTIRASYYYGAPLVGKELRYRMNNGQWFSAKTDDKGEIAFKLPTREYRETMTLGLAVQFPERGMMKQHTMLLATRGFSIGLDTTRDTYLAGETFGLKVTSLDAEGEPIAKDLKLGVYRVTDLTENEMGEVLVSEHELKTDADDGLVQVTQTLKEGGTHRLRVSGTDRFGNPVESEVELFVSDDTDDTRLRILAERHDFKAGEKAKIRVHWRDDPTLALITYQGAKILDYRLVELKQGENEIVIPMTVELAPNFEFDVSLMSMARDIVAKPEDDADPDAVANDDSSDDALPRRFHQATSDFTVERDLQLTLTVTTPGEAEHGTPGGEVEIGIETKDPSGKPVSAEVSLAMIEAALLERFSSPLARIDAFFRGLTRQSAMRTTSSVEFAYQPDTRNINPRLLAEAERVEFEGEQRRLAELYASDRGRNNNADGAIDSDSLVELRMESLDVTYDHFGAPSDQSGNGQPYSGNHFGFGQRDLSRFGRPGQAMGGGGAFFGGQAAQQVEMQRETASLESLSDEVIQLNDFAENDRLRSWAALGAMRGSGLSGRLESNGERTLGIRFGYRFESFNKQIERDESLPVLNTNGAFYYVPLDKAAGEAATPEERHANALAFFQDNNVLPNQQLNETGYWNPTIVTDARGQAKLSVDLPNRSTQWKFIAKGITANTMAGQAEASLRTKKDLFAQLKLPQGFTEGDKATITATIHNQAIAEGELSVEFTATIGGKKVTQSRKLKVAEKGIIDTSFEVEIALPDDASRSGSPDVVADFELTVTAGETSDTIAQSVSVRPNGMNVFAIAGGTAQADAAAFVSAPEGMTLAAQRMQILISPSVKQSLYDAVLAPANWCQLDARSLASATDQATSDLMAALALQSITRKAAGEEADPRAELLDQEVRGSLRSLISLQRDDGGFPWGGSSANSNPLATARAVWALQMAGAAGYRIGDNTLAAATTRLADDLSKTAVSDYDTKAVLLHGLTVAGKGDFPLANQLYRNRQSLSPMGLAYLALAMAEMDRTAPADDLLNLLDERNLSQPAAIPGGGDWPWAGSEAELRAIYALTVQKSAPQDAKLRTQVEWLMAHRTGNRWSPDRATGPAMLAAAHLTRFDAGDETPYKLTVFVNDKKAAEVERDGSEPFDTIDVDPKLLKADGKQEVRFQITGRGEYVYQCVLGGYVPSDKLKSTAKSWHIYRYYQPAGLELDGVAVPSGFNVVAGSYTSYRNELKQLPVGSRGKVDLHVTRSGAGNTDEKQRSYLVVTEPLPAGAVVLESSISGRYDRYEIGPSEITFYVGNHSNTHIQFEIHGYAAGEYTAPPTVARDAYRFDQFVVSGPITLSAPLEGSSITDEYRLTPRELYELGGRHFQKERYAKSIEYLEKLLADWSLTTDYHRDSVRMLMEAHLQAGKPAGVVKNFEIIIEKYPGLEIPFDKLLAVGDAYHAIGEYERSFLVFRAVVEASFFRESRAAGFLQSQQEPLRSVDLMASLVRQYPPEAYNAEAKYALAQQVYGLAPQATSQAKLKEAKLTGIEITNRAFEMLDGFLTAYPQDPSADQAAFAAASALLEMESYERAITLAERAVERYADSEYRDSYWYIVGYSRYAQGKYEAALEMNRKVAEAVTIDPRTGREEESRNKWRAIYILGQIYHSLDQAEKAIAEYRKVEERFPDAAAAIEYFAHEDIKLPEVTSIKPDAKATVELSHRNVKQVEVAAYRIDLMKFSLLRRSLSGVTEINLAGIKPTHTQTIELGDGKDFRDRTTEIALPLKEEGAYFLVCRAGNHHTTGLALITPLELEVTEDATSGDVRTTVRNKMDNSFAADVHVKVIGSRNQEFDSGETDLRGVFAADAITGRAMVIAQADDGKYAFYRGERELGSPPPAPNAPAEPEASAEMDGKASTKQQLLEGIRGGNQMLQQEQGEKLDKFYNNSVDEGIGGGFGGGFF